MSNIVDAGKFSSMVTKFDYVIDVEQDFVYSEDGKTKLFRVAVDIGDLPKKSLVGEVRNVLERCIDEELSVTAYLKGKYIHLIPEEDNHSPERGSNDNQQSNNNSSFNPSDYRMDTD